MKTLIIIVLFAFTSTLMMGQTASFTNIVCTDHSNPAGGVNDGTISFDLAITENSTPINITTTEFRIRDLNNEPLTIGTSLKSGDGETFSVNELPLRSNVKCEDLVDRQVILETRNNSALADDFQTLLTDAAPIPTMGQWALMILGLLMASLGVIAIKRKALARAID